MNQFLIDHFVNLLSKYTDDNHLIHELWTEIENNYNSKKRHYHTLSHLSNLLQQLSEAKDKIESWDAILFSTYYHDIIYNVLKPDNEERSAELAEKRMKQLAAPGQAIERCKNQILATKKHLHNSEPDTNFFTDADLSILGQNWDNYTDYYLNVRKEYSIYPDVVYNPGRKKVLNHFLEMKRIFKTQYFFDKFEDQAKENIRRELEILICAKS